MVQTLGQRLKNKRWIWTPGIVDDGDHVIVTLSLGQQQTVANQGIMRRGLAIKRGRKEFEGPPTDPWDKDIESCGSEFAVSLFTGLVWYSMAERPKDYPGDVGHLEVRHTKLEHGKLLLKKRDADDAPVFLVTGSLPVMRIRGWMYARDGKKPEYWCTEKMREPCYMAPQCLLQPARTWPRRPL